MHLRLDGEVCFYRQLFSDVVKPRGCISCPVWPLRGINRTAWGAKLILTADLAFPVSCASMGHLLMAQHCLLVFECLLQPTPPHPPHIDSIRDITAIEKTTSKTRDVQIACRISKEILASQLGFLYCKFDAGILHYYRATAHLILQIIIS